MLHSARILRILRFHCLLLAYWLQQLPDMISLFQMCSLLIFYGVQEFHPAYCHLLPLQSSYPSAEVLYATQPSSATRVHEIAFVIGAKQ